MSSRQGSPHRQNQSPITPFWTPRTSFSQPSKPEWNAKPQMSNENIGYLGRKLERLESNRGRELVLNPDFITYIYNYVKMVAGSVRDNNFRALGYNVDMITIVGGTVLTLYDNFLEGIKRKYEMNHLKHYVERDTLDIDAVWCLPVYAGPIHFDRRIDPFLDDFIKRFNLSKPPVLLYQLSDMKCIKDISGILRGTIHLKVICTIGMVEHEVFDLAIHDSRSSQRFNENYNEIKEYQSTLQDPIYCSLQNTLLLPFGEMGIRVPLIYVFIQQQLFAFGNVLLYMDGSNVIKGELIPKSNKGYIHLRRVLYILHMLTLIQPNNQNNTQLLTGLDVYPIANYISGITADIEKRRQLILHKLPPKDKVTFNKKMDMILREFDLPRSVLPSPLHVHFPVMHPPHITVQHHLPRHASATSASSGHASPRHGSPKSASAQSDPLDEIEKIIIKNKDLIRSFRSSFQNKSVIDHFQKVHKVSDENLKRIQNFFHNASAYKSYNMSKKPESYIKLIGTVIDVAPYLNKYIEGQKSLSGLSPVVNTIVVKLTAIQNKLRPSGGRRRTQKKRRTRKR